MHTLSDYTFSLPPELIAQELHSPADECKLLTYSIPDGDISDEIFRDSLLNIDPSTHVFVNKTKVCNARIPVHFPWSGRVKARDGEIFFLKKLDEFTFEALVRPWKKFSVWTNIPIDEKVSFNVVSLSHEGRTLRCSQPIEHALREYGQLPLPPYIEYKEETAWSYQPIFAQDMWSTAAPTASLHFTDTLVESLKQKWVQFHDLILHVGLGTFKPVDTDDITQYDIHAEECSVACSLFSTIARAKEQQEPLLSIWTTVTRTLESLPYLWKRLSEENDFLAQFDDDVIRFWNQLTVTVSLDQAHQFIPHVSLDQGHLSFSTQLYLYPWSRFFVIDQLITNFHLPKSSLLMLVWAFIWYDNMKKVYAHAIEQKYRFYSFWDAMRIR